MSFSFIDIILFIGVSQGLFLATTLRVLHDRNKNANRILSMTIAIAVVMLLGRIVILRVEGDWLMKLAVAVDTTIFLFGPLIYTYVRRLSFKESPLFKLSFWHFVPASLHAFYALLFAILPPSLITTYQEGITDDVVMLSVETIGLLSFIIYTVMCISLLKRFNREIKNELSYDLTVRRYLMWLVGALVISTVLWIISYSSYLFGEYVPYLDYTSVWISIPLFIYIIGYFSLRQPEIFRMPFVPKQHKERPRLKPDEIKILQKRLQYYIKEEKIFLQSDLTLKELGGKMETSGNNLSWLLNQVYQKSFYEYINEQRLKEVLHKIDQGIHIKQTLLAIAMDAGFNSKSTFNKAFKNYTGSTPTQYIKEKNAA